MSTTRLHAAASATRQVPDRTAPTRRWIVVAGTLGVALVELVRAAWISDDAAITLRSVLNLLNGFGATFNIDERVQAFTHPLWFLLIAAASAIVRNVFAATFILSMLVSLAAVWLLITRVARTLWTGVLGAFVLMCSSAYVDFSTSGLENPLAHLLILVAVLLGAAIDHRTRPAVVTAFFTVCSLLYLCRPDLLILMGPLALLVIVRHRHAPAGLARSMALGALPVAAWTLFALFYYGAPFPNTAYAKLGAGVPLAERVVQGVAYLRDSIARDPLTLAVVLLGAAIGLRSSWPDAVLAGGGLLYLAYVVSIGGDFMTGRFLTAPFLVSAALIARADLSRWRLGALAGALAILAASGAHPPLLTDSRYAGSEVSDAGIADERAYYFQRYGLTAAPEHTFDEPQWEVGERTVLVLCANLGFTGIDRGPGAHLIDTCALSDPLLARLPAERTRRWRIGHFLRQLPTDYEESIAQNANLLADERTRNFYRTIRSVTRGPLTSPARLRDIVRLNLGLVPAPDWDMYHHTKVPASSRPSAD